MGRYVCASDSLRPGQLDRIVTGIKDKQKAHRILNGKNKMRIDIELITGPYGNHKFATKKDMDINIKALERVIEGKPLPSDIESLVSTKSILEGIQRQLPT